MWLEALGLVEAGSPGRNGPEYEAGYGRSATERSPPFATNAPWRNEVMDRVAKLRCAHVCLTGGEPLAQKGAPKLLKKLLDEGYQVVLETNGAMPLDDLPCVESLTISMDIKCPSSGVADKMLFGNIELLGPTDQLKFIISNDADYEYAKEIIEKYSPKCEVILTPVGGKDLKSLAEKVLKHGLNVRVLPQLHKFIWGDEDNR